MRQYMLVEGGYLHSMKLLIEKAMDTPDQPSHDATRDLANRSRKASGTVVTSLRRLSVILLGGGLED